LECLDSHGQKVDAKLCEPVKSGVSASAELQ
jgi:hypothetical protein